MNTNHDDVVIYEQPANENIRLCLRLEYLFDKLKNCIEGHSVWHIRSAIECLVELLEVSDRSDLRKLLSKEIQYFSHYLQQLESAEGVDLKSLKSILAELHEIDVLLQIHGHSFSQNLRRYEFLNAIRMHRGNPGSSAPFDLPLYHYWLSRPDEVRQGDLDMWLSSVTPIERVVRFILKLLRDSHNPTSVVAIQGFYQMALDPKVPCQMVRIILQKNEDLFPEVSIGKHHLAIRFLIPDLLEKSQPSFNDVNFQLTCCFV